MYEPGFSLILILIAPVQRYLTSQSDILKIIYLIPYYVLTITTIYLLAYVITTMCFLA